MAAFDGLDNDITRFGLGLLASSGNNANFGQGLLSGIGAVDENRQRKAAAKRAQQAEEFQAFQMQQAMAQAEAQKAAAQEQSRVNGILPSLITRPSQAAPALNVDSLLPPEFRAGTPTQAAVPASEGGFNMQEALRQRVPLKTIEELQKLTAGPEYSPEVRYDQEGRAFMTAKNGAVKYLDKIKARDKLIETDLGGTKGFRTEYSPTLLGSLPKTQSPDSVASNALGWANNAATLRGQNMTDARARDLNDITRGEKKKVEELTKGGQIASFDTMLGTLDRLGKHPGLSRSVGLTGAFPTMPGSDSANFQAELDTFQSQAFIPMVSQLKGMGALSDAEGKKLTAAVGALNPKMGEKAFRESVQRITDEMESARARVSGQPSSTATKKTVVKTGMYGGKKVVQYSDGSTAYAD